MSLEDDKIKIKSKLPSPLELKKQLPISDKIHNFILDTRYNIKSILDNHDDKLIIIVGPCSIHNYESTIEYAKYLKTQRDRYINNLEIVMRTYFSKPRTSVGWKGFIYDPYMDGSSNIKEGLYLARKLLIEILEIGIPCCMEHVDTIIPQYFDDLLCWGAIGARTTESQIHRELASGISTPIGFKNSTNGNIDVAINGIKCANNEHTFLGINCKGQVCSLQTKGNPYGHIILRGGNNGPNYYPNNVNSVIERMKKEKICKSIIIDFSHGNSQKKHKNQLIVCNSISEQILNGNYFIKGVMIESNLVEGNQDINNKPLIYGQSITDACVNLEDTSKMLFQLYLAKS